MNEESAVYLSTGCLKKLKSPCTLDTFQSFLCSSTFVNYQLFKMFTSLSTLKTLLFLFSDLWDQRKFIIFRYIKGLLRHKKTQIKIVANGQKSTLLIYWQGVSILAEMQSKENWTWKHAKSSIGKHNFQGYHRIRRNRGQLFYPIWNYVGSTHEIHLQLHQNPLFLNFLNKFKLF